MVNTYSLAAQLAALGHLGADVFCLQEVFDDVLARDFINYFKSKGKTDMDVCLEYGVWIIAYILLSSLCDRNVI